MAATTTFLQLQTEFYARGYDYLNDGGAGVTRAKAWINQAYQLDVCEDDLWPFLLTTVAGAAPLAIADLRAIKTVTDTATSRLLWPSQEDELTDEYVLLTTTGAPTSYWVDDLTVRTYPVGGTLSVRYWKVPATLVNTTDIAVVPDRFCNLIVDAAVRRAANDSEAPASVQMVKTELAEGLDQMRESLLFRDGTRHYQRRTYSAIDG